MEQEDSEKIIIDDSVICPNCQNQAPRGVSECPKCKAILIFDAPTVEERIARVRDCSLAEFLLREREYLFESIYNGEGLWKKIIYCVIYSALFAGIYGLVLGAGSGVVGCLIMGLRVPGLLFAALLITVPVLFTFNIFIGAKLNFLRILTMMLVGTYYTGMVLLSLAPIMLLFVIYSDGSGFMHILNIVFFLIAGGLGVGLLWKGMEYFIIKSGYDVNSFALKVWAAIYIFVGLQLAWSFRVFGDLSQLPLFKRLGIEGNFYMALFQLIKGLISGD